MNNKLDKQLSYYSMFWLLVAMVAFCTIWLVGLWHTGRAVIKFFWGMT